ncbi:hypothetical protein [Sinomicrobium weinanense]|uniref:Protochlamydia outer membrane protein domain-containing protein n=1 Tax=Sinomicrobium weinanense TaxID=2842200 RepID=A0A926JQ93_9FLAO|nr:hypothetical protein [Sinomicrobium weinanense]MBC9795261.1 hypothetical protein [Sinomicrobium weinanense]MBU3125733.1 hypothetical protein [Sinomicrobium weinanense]
MFTTFRFFLVFCFLFLFFDGLHGQEIRRNGLSIQPYVKYRQEDLRWSVAGDIRGQNPNILSELIWKRIQGPEAGVLFGKRISKRFSVQMDMSYMAIASGRVTDADYSEDNRQGNFYREKLRADKGYVLSFDARLQYCLLVNSGIRIIPFLGYTSKYQHLYMLDNKVPLIEGKELKSTYTPHWYGGSAGSTFIFDIQKFRILLEVEGDLVKYTAGANWNLREELAHPVSFKHHATGKGVNARLFVEYPIGKKTYITFNTDISYLETGKGRDKTFYQSGSEAVTRLNSVINRSFGIGCGLKFKLL